MNCFTNILTRKKSVHLVRRNIVILTEASNIGKVGIKMCTNVLASLLFLIEISRMIRNDTEGLLCCQVTWKLFRILCLRM